MVHKLVTGSVPKSQSLRSSNGQKEDGNAEKKYRFQKLRDMGKRVK